MYKIMWMDVLREICRHIRIPMCQVMFLKKKRSGTQVKQGKKSHTIRSKDTKNKQTQTKMEWTDANEQTTNARLAPRKRFICLFSDLFNSSFVGSPFAFYLSPVSCMQVCTFRTKSRYANFFRRIRVLIGIEVNLFTSLWA